MKNKTSRYELSGEAIEAPFVGRSTATRLIYY